MGIIKQCIADYDEELVKMSKVAEALQHITTDLKLSLIHIFEFCNRTVIVISARTPWNVSYW